jgi:long-chain acyl-CoA synthetase
MLWYNCHMNSNRPWLARYAPQITHEVDIDRYRNLVEVFTEACDKYSSKTAFSNMGVGLSYTELDRLSAQFASYLQNVLKLKKGDRVAIQMPNLLQYPVVLFGILRAGMVVVNTNPLYTPREMRHQFADSGARAVVILANFASKLDEIIAQTAIEAVIVTEVGDQLPPLKRVITNFVVKSVKKMVPPFQVKHETYLDALARGATSTYRPVELGHGDTAFLQYTGGTTGVSKGAVLTHRNIISNMLQIAEWMKPMLRDGNETILCALPLYHIFSLTVNCLGLFKGGMENVLITNPRDLPSLFKDIRRSNPTVLVAVNTLLAAMMNAPEFKTLKMQRLKVSVAGGMALKGAVANAWKAATGTPVLEGYGLTEASPVVSCNPLDGTEQVGTIGLPVPSTDVKVIDEKGNALGFGQEGELCVRGPQVMKEYWNHPEETRAVLSSDGWLKTGDMAVAAEDGFFKIVDRKKDMILVSGFNVYPNEVEEVMSHHPKVLETAAIGVDDKHSGEAVKIFVVLRNPAEASDKLKDELIAFARKELTGYKVPKHVEFRKELPKTNVGKVLRRALKEGTA